MRSVPATDGAVVGDSLTEIRAEKRCVSRATSSGTGSPNWGVKVTFALVTSIDGAPESSTWMPVRRYSTRRGGLWKTSAEGSGMPSPASSAVFVVYATSFAHASDWCTRLTSPWMASVWAFWIESGLEALSGQSSAHSDG